MELLPNLPNIETHEDNDSHFASKFLVYKQNKGSHPKTLNWYCFCLQSSPWSSRHAWLFHVPNCQVRYDVSTFPSSPSHLWESVIVYEVCYLAVVNGHLESSLMVLPLCTWACCFYPSSKHLTVQVNRILYLHIPAVPQFWAYHLFSSFAVAW